MKVKIWDSLNEEEEDADEVEVPNYAEPSAASLYFQVATAKYMEDRWSDTDHPAEMEINIRLPAGKLLELTATAQPTVCFSAAPRKKR